MFFMKKTLIDHDENHVLVQYEADDQEQTVLTTTPTGVSYSGSLRYTECANGHTYADFSGFYIHCPYCED